MKIHLVNKQKTLPINRPMWKKAVEAVALLQKEDFEEVTLHFVDKKTISQIHADYFDDPSPTDCISFPLDEPGEPYRVLGEVFICPDVAKDYVEKKGGSLENETMLYAVHGLLHLFGYDDLTPPEKKQMRRLEKKHLDNLGKLGIIQPI